MSTGTSTTVAICPACTDEVRVPAGVADDAQVRCPLCREEFQLSEVLEQLPPLLEVIDAGSVADTSAAPGFALAPAAAASGGAAPFNLGESAAPGGAVVSPGTASARRRTSRKKSNPLREVVKVFGGGVIGLAIGQIVLWWLPGSFGVSQRDPVGLGRKIAGIAPWIVPEQIREAAKPLAGDKPDNADPNKQGANATSQGGNPGAGNRNPGRRPAPETAAGEFDLNRIGMNAAASPTGADVPGTGGDIPGTGGDIPGTGGEPQLNLNDLSSGGGGGRNPGLGGGGLNPSLGGSGLGGSGLGDIGADIDLGLPDLKIGGDMPKLPDSPPVVPDSPPVVPDSPPVVPDSLPSSDAATSGDAATSKDPLFLIVQYDQTANDPGVSRGDKIALFGRIYEGLARLGADGAATDAGAAASQQAAIGNILKQWHQPENDAKRVALQMYASWWLDEAQGVKRTSDGIALSGQVTKVGEQDGASLLHVKLSDRTVGVLSDQPAGDFADGAEVIVLGKLLNAADAGVDSEQTGLKAVVRGRIIVSPEK